MHETKTYLEINVNNIETKKKSMVTMMAIRVKIQLNRAWSIKPVAKKAIVILFSKEFRHFMFCSRNIIKFRDRKKALLI